ncbi:mediator of RNA polymerase II transcription subunit 13 [Xylographa trunciseda]|nr:mediator of RNA polymerase II transcription subunit 13 [Xylographa trunciseda]
MEFPRNAPTNVHKIGGILFIQWSVYGLETATESGSGRNIDSTKRTFDTLHAAEYELRRSGNHVLHDQSQGVLWVFDLSGPSVRKEPRADYLKGVLALVGRYNLKKLLFGSLRASDMIDTPTPSHELLFSLAFWLHLEQCPDSSSLARTTSRAKPLAISQDNIFIYKKIIQAISMSILYFLAGTDYYVPLSSNAFLVPKRVEEHILSHSAEYQDTSDLFNTFCLEVQWLSCGTLVIYSYPDPSMLWHNLAEVHSTQTSFQDSELKLAPFGTSATQHYQGLGEDELMEQSEEATESGEESRLQGLKPSILSLLEQHGLQLSDHCEWLRVNIRSPVSIPTDMRSDVFSSGTILWPAHLCFHEDYKSTTGKDSPVWLWPGLEKGATDPLKAAESWFLGKDEREKAIERRRIETEARLRTELQDNPLDEDDFLTTGFQTIDRHIDIQGANGIYPTPPDGFQAQPLGRALDRGPYDQANFHDDSEMLDLVEGQTDVLERNDQQSGLETETGMSLGTYGDIEDDDLFGDMDSAMFTAKGITEDDFDFFDEPEELNRHVHSTFPADPMVKRELAASSSAEEALIAKPSTSIHVDMILDEAQSTSEYKAVLIAQPTQANNVKNAEPEIDRNQSSPQLSPQSIEDILEHHAMPVPFCNIDPSSNTTFRREQTSEDQLSIFGNIPLWETSRNLDQKYKDRGRFSIDAGKRKGDFHREQGRVEKSIPLLGQFTQHSDEEFESDQDYGTNEARTPNSSTAYDVHEAITDIGKNQVPQTPLSPIDNKDINTNSETLPVVPQMSPGMNELPTNSSLQSSLAELPQQVYRGHDAKFIQIAQILADQLLAYAKADDHDEFFPDLGATVACHGVPFEDPLRDILGGLFSHDEICTLEACAGLSEVPRGTCLIPKTVPRPVQRKQDSVRGPHDVPSCPSISSLISPNLRVARGDTLMDISSTALQFWEELGLSPCMGSKDVTAFCVYPQTEMVQRGSASFMKLVSSTFQSLRLGAYSCGSKMLDEFPEGLVPVSLNAHDIEGAMQEIDAVCEYLGEKLSQLGIAGETIVIYMVNPFCTLHSLPRLCESFLRCFERYVSSANVAPQVQSADLVLKLLPISWVASTTTIALSSPKEYIRLVKDIYDRCPAKHLERNLSPYASASLVQIAEDIPKTLYFSLTPDPTKCLTQENEAVHVGYSWGSDSQWLCSSVTDNFGRLQWNASYSLGDNVHDPWPVLSLVVQDIWKGLIEMIGQRNQHFSVYVAKDTPIDQREIDAWLLQHALPENPSMTLTILFIETCPPIYHSISKIFPSSLDGGASHIATPESTPLANSLTPENLASPGFVGGPGGRVADQLDTDSNLRLLNIMDQTWAVSFCRALYTRSNEAVAKHYLGSGYLTKRAGEKDEYGWVMMGVHVVHAEKWTEPHMKDLLGMYGSLGMIAKARGVENEITSVIPWHIAVASRAQKGLNMMMRYDNGGSGI